MKRRLAQNREAARKSRQRRKQYVAKLEEEVRRTLRAIAMLSKAGSCQESRQIHTETASQMLSIAMAIVLRWTAQGSMGFLHLLPELMHVELGPSHLGRTRRTQLATTVMESPVACVAGADASVAGPATYTAAATAARAGTEGSQGLVSAQWSDTVRRRRTRPQAIPAAQQVFAPQLACQCC